MTGGLLPAQQSFCGNNACLCFTIFDSEHPGKNGETESVESCGPWLLLGSRCQQWPTLKILPFSPSLPSLLSLHPFPLLYSDFLFFRTQSQALPPAPTNMQLSGTADHAHACSFDWQAFVSVGLVHARGNRCGHLIAGRLAILRQLPCHQRNLLLHSGPHVLFSRKEG